MKIFGTILAITLTIAAFGFAVYLAVDLIRTIKRRHDIKHGKQPKPKKEKDLDF